MDRLIVFIFVLLIPLRGFCMVHDIQYDFGVIASDVPVSHRLIVPQRVVHVASLCECVAVVVDPASDDKKSVMVITFDPQGYQGTTEQKIMLITEKKEVVTVVIRADVRDGEIKE